MEKKKWEYSKEPGMICRAESIFDGINEYKIHRESKSWYKFTPQDYSHMYTGQADHIVSEEEALAYAKELGISEEVFYSE